ncbi:MAG: hypothetical protein GWP10_22510 [Nitrospiraceae bacterium]|nr:hypothetical protein [Nitrospiraceae bacterium]
MKKLFIALFLIPFVLSCGGSSSSDKTNYWDFMVYMDADNSLNDASSPDINEMEKGISSNNIKVFVLLDDKSHNGKLYEIENGKAVELKSYGELDMGDPVTLENFILFVENNFPAKRYALDMWDHGDGWRDIKSRINRIASEDDDNGNGQTDYLFMHEMVEALENLKDSGYNLNLIGFDECDMGMIEVAYDLEDYTDAIVGSELSEPGPGWDYKKVLSYLSKNPYVDAYTFGRAIVDAYRDTYRDGTMAVYRPSDVEKIVKFINEISDSYISDSYSDHAYFKTARDNSVKFNNGTYVDLGSLAKNLYESSNKTLKDALELCSDVESIYHFSTGNYTGTSIYFPENGSYQYQYDEKCYGYSYSSPGPCYGENDYYNPFAVNHYDEFLESYYGGQ